jgi:hypothetical protein
MPPDAASGSLRADGHWQLPGGRTLPPWAVAEIGRLATVLRSQHATFLERAVGAIGGTLSPEFERPDNAFPIRDDDSSIVVTDSVPGLDVDLSDSDMVGRGLPWYEVTRRNYRRDRFMRTLTDEQLERRLADIVPNATSVTPAGLIAPGPLNDELMYWFDRFTEVSEEIALRYGPFPNGFSQGRIRFRGLPGSLDPRNLGRPTQLLPRRQLAKPILAKYGKAKYLVPALDSGHLRIAPASLYSDPSLNAAIQADDLSEEIRFAANVLPPTEPPHIELPPVMWVKVTKRFPTNYYVLCLSSALELRLLFDFEADRCLLVHDPPEFARRLSVAVCAALPGWKALSGAVEYFDPLQVTPAQVHFPMAKHFRYAYQKESRFVWLPPAPVETLEPLFVDLGPLRDIAEMMSPSRPG